MRVGVFELVDPPDGQAELVAQAVAAIDYPWSRLLPGVWRDPDRAVVVQWGELKQNVTGTYTDTTVTIDLESRTARQYSDVRFVFAHEVGHLVDGRTLDRHDRTALRELMHAGPFVKLGHYDHDHPDAGHGSEDWRTSKNAYTSRLNEAYADLFVAAFAPDIWNGELPGTRQHWPRFVHHTDDLQAVREITLRRPIVPFPDVAPDRWSAPSIEKAAALGVLTGRADGRFDPTGAVTREQLAAVLDRLGLLDPRG